MSDVFVPLYHGVVRDSEYAADPFERVFQKHLPESEFEEQIRWLCDNYRVLRADEFVEKALSGAVSEPFALITFDDLYANFRSNALPILEEYGVCAAAFLCTGFARGTRISWTDEIERVVMNARPSELRVLGSSYCTARSQDRIDTVLELKRVAKSVSAQRQEQLVARLLEDYDTGTELAKANMLNWTDVAELREHPLVEFYHHSHGHCVLKNQAAEELQRDLERNIGILGDPVYFAYPYGVRGVHFDDQVKAAIRRKGFRAAFSVATDPSYQQIDPYEIPRKEMRVGDHLRVGAG